MDAVRCSVYLQQIMSGPSIGLGGCNVAVEEHHRFLEHAVIQIVQGAYLATSGSWGPDPKSEAKSQALDGFIPMASGCIMKLANSQRILRLDKPPITRK